MKEQTLDITKRPGAAEALSFLTTPEAAKVLRLGKRTVQEKVEAGEISVIRIGRRVLFDRADLAEFMDRHKQRAAGWKGGRTA